MSNTENLFQQIFQEKQDKSKKRLDEYLKEQREKQKT